MIRASAAMLVCLFCIAPAVAQTQAEGQMRLYIQELEERVRQLTGENERLAYEVNQLRAELGMGPLGAEPAETGAVSPGQTLGGLPAGQPGAQDEIGMFSVSPDDPLIAPDGAGAEGPVDLSTLATDAAPEFAVPQPGGPEGEGAGTDTAMAPAAPPPVTSLSGSASDEYDLAYGYVLTGDYDLAEESFRTWLAAFPDNQQAPDARFWLGESHLQQGEYREAATEFLAVYKAAPDSAKAPDALLKLGTSLSALGEKETACATLAEVAKRYSGTSESLMSRVHAEEGRAGC
jgi:tol-pal system protein YbgF